MPSETIRLDGHIIDSLTISKVLDIILREGGEYRITRFTVGTTKSDASHAEISVSAPDAALLESILHNVQQHGAARASGEAHLEPAPKDGVFPEGFYATTNLETAVRSEGQWLPVEPIEMDCGIVITELDGELSALCTPMHRIKQGNRVVVGDGGIRVSPVERRDATDAFSFMGSEVSTERPKELVVAAIAQAMREARAQGQKILFVGGPAILHTGAGRHLEAIITSGLDRRSVRRQRARHPRHRARPVRNLARRGTGHRRRPWRTATNIICAPSTRIRAAGGIRQAVQQGVLTPGIMHACVTTGIDFVLAGSIRDDGPLPDVITDSVQAQDAMRARVQGVGVALMVATTLHSVATGNLLPASVRTLCVDSDADTVIKLMDRGTHQAFGLVTDCEFFLKELAARLPGVTL